MKKNKRNKRNKVLNETEKIKLRTKIKKLFERIKMKLINVIAILFLLSPQLLEILNIHSEMIKEEFGATYYLTIFIIVSCVNYYNTLNNIKNKMKDKENKEEEKE